MAQLREHNIQIYNQTNFTIYKQPKIKDTFWSEKKKVILKLSKLKISQLSENIGLKE